MARANYTFPAATPESVTASPASGRAPSGKAGRSATDDVEQVLRRLDAWGAAREWVGPDPYEGLNTPLARIAPGKKGRQAVVQAYKRLPFAPPWPLSAPSRPNTKALGLVLAGYATVAGADLPGATSCASLGDRLRAMRVPAAGGAAWGYHFDLQTRHLFYRASSANAVATAFAAEGLLDEYARSGDRAIAETVLECRPFLLALMQTSAPSPYFAYVEKGSRLVHNANLLVCGLLARLHEISPDAQAANAARAAALTTIRAQDGNGLWPYGDSPGLEWADSFHTAYILESLLRTERAFGVGGEALDTGLAAWRERFFDDRHNARYLPDSPYPLEAHSFASAIDLCWSVRSLSDEWLDFGTRLAVRAIELLWLPDSGRFAHRATRRGRNDREFVRWTNAPMFRALARLLSASR